MSVDPYGRAIRDYYLGKQDGPLIDRAGAAVRIHPIEEFYFRDVSGEGERQRWVDSWLDGPLLDMGAGVGSQALYWQEQCETVALDVNERLVETMSDRGVETAVHADMFALRDRFERNRFNSAHAKGTQVMRAGSMEGLREFLGDLAYVTTPEATAVFDGYDPDHEETTALFGYRDDPTPGLGYRVYQHAYRDRVGETLVFRLVSPDRLREATIGTGWEVTEIKRDPEEHGYSYTAALTKR